MTRRAQVTRRGLRGRAATAAAALAICLVPALGLTACSNESWPAGTDKGTSAENGAFTELAPEQRGAPVAFEGPGLDGATISSSQYAGRVSVVNFWYAACPPCRAEAKDLETVAQQYAAQDVPFLGVNIYDMAPTVESFNQSYGVTYPTILDVDSAAVRLAFAETVPPQAIPSTVVLDRQGRVAAVIRGPIDVSVLGAMLDRVLAEAA